jgi:hypothetical protein
MERKVPALNSFKTIDRVVIDLHKEEDVSGLKTGVNNGVHVNKINPAFKPQSHEKGLNYDNILSSMGMKLVNGKLELYNKELQQRHWNPSYQAQESYVNQLKKPTPCNQKAGCGSNPYLHAFLKTGPAQGSVQRQMQRQMRSQMGPIQRSEAFRPRPVSLEKEKEKGMGEEEEGAKVEFDPVLYAKRLRLLNYIKRVREVQRLNEIKSRKLMFNNPNVHIGISRSYGGPSNKLFRFVGVRH